MQRARQREHCEHTRDGLQLGWVDSLRATDARSKHRGTSHVRGLKQLLIRGDRRDALHRTIRHQQSQPTKRCWSQPQTSRLCRHAQAQQRLERLHPSLAIDPVRS